jgi:GTP-binding protein Era
VAKHSGFVVITGKPNVGKSTLLNTIMKAKYVVTSRKPQTTRNHIFVSYENDNSNIVFIDTPGFHFGKTMVENLMNKEIKKAYKKADIALILIDSTRIIDDEDITVLKNINTFEFSKKFIVYTKCEKINENAIKENNIVINKYMKFDDYICISSNQNTNIDKLMEMISNNLELSDETINIDYDDNIFITDTIREVIINNFKEEIPYATNVEIEQKQYDEGIFKISCNIVVEKESQKPILIGAKGSMIKKIGVNSRMELLKMYDCKVDLRLNVIVKKD